MAEIKRITDLQLGDKIAFGKFNANASTDTSPMIWKIADFNHPGFPANSVTLLSDTIIDHMVYDTADTTFTSGDPDFNHSNINQWLNGYGTNWYTQAYNIKNAEGTSVYSDATPTYSTRRGFLTGFTDRERDLILPTTVSYRADQIGELNQKIAWEGSEEYMGTTQDRYVLLPSIFELGINIYSSEDMISDGSKFALMNNLKNLKLDLSAELKESMDPSAMAIEQKNLVTRSSSNKMILGQGGANLYAINWGSMNDAITGAPADTDMDFQPSSTQLADILTEVKASDTNPILPFCNIKDDIFVTYDSTSGCYTVVNNISDVEFCVDDTDFGTKVGEFDFEYSVMSSSQSGDITVKFNFTDGTNTQTITSVVAANTSNHCIVSSEVLDGLDDGLININVNIVDTNSQQMNYHLKFIKQRPQQTKEVTAIESTMYNATEEGEFQLALPSTLSNNVYTDITVGETVQDQLNRLNMNQSVLWTNSLFNQWYLKGAVSSVKQIVCEDGLVIAQSRNGFLKSFDQMGKSNFGQESTELVLPEDGGYSDIDASSYNFALRKGGSHLIVSDPDKCQFTYYGYQKGKYVEMWNFYLGNVNGKFNKLIPVDNGVIAFNKTNKTVYKTNIIGTELFTVEPTTGNTIEDVAIPNQSVIAITESGGRFKYLSLNDGTEIENVTLNDSVFGIVANDNTSDEKHSVLVAANLTNTAIRALNNPLEYGTMGDNDPDLVFGAEIPAEGEEDTAVTAMTNANTRILRVYIGKYDVENEETREIETIEKLTFDPIIRLPNRDTVIDIQTCKKSGMIFVLTNKNDVFIFDKYGKYVSDIETFGKVTAIGVDNNGDLVTGNDRGEVYYHTFTPSKFTQKTHIQNIAIEPLMWKDYNHPEFGNIYRFDILNSIITEYSSVDVDMNTLTSLFYANKAEVMPIVTEHNGYASIYAQSVPEKILYADVSIKRG